MHRPATRPPLRPLAGALAALLPLGAMIAPAGPAAAQDQKVIVPPGVPVVIAPRGQAMIQPLPAPPPVPPLAPPPDPPLAALSEPAAEPPEAQPEAAPLVVLPAVVKLGAGGAGLAAPLAALVPMLGAAALGGAMAGGGDGAAPARTR